jgi:N-acetylglucosaminyldiphosphoundecaprenol N-acetyl-beta-D-mannosaminyltransferase
MMISQSASEAPKPPGIGYPRVDILGVAVSAVNLQQVLASFDEWIARRENAYVCVTPAHSVMDCYRDPELRSIFNASGLTVPDGMSLVWLLRLYGYRKAGRVYGPDLMRAVCERSVEAGWSHLLYGGGPGVPETLKARLEASFPGIRIVGTYSPPFRALTESEDTDIIRRINDLQPDILWLGVSSPKQERWMRDHLGKAQATVMVGVGAAFDFLSGSKRQAPYWIQRSGLEWLFRLFSEPKRLWPRYRQYPRFVWLVLRQLALGGPRQRR